MFEKYASSWQKVATDAAANAPTLKSAVKSSDIGKELQVVDNYLYLLSKLQDLARELQEMKEEATRPPAKLLGDDTKILALTKDVNKMGEQATEAGAKMKSSAKSIASKMTKLGSAINLAREKQDSSAVGTKAIRAMVAYGEKVLKVVSSGPLVNESPADLVASIKADPNKAPVIGSNHRQQLVTSVRIKGANSCLTISARD